ncbi:alpha/beta hydrolase [Novipirellula artificiosorum]|uniref:Alpha/beta hydrolase family protein n=1 Tax=Novipirellula artificiosorum TaxID=2528016 RepID=A0A5C6DM22_9BACT|nr:alpha/beta hydrolase [Novipirellula artificiosorum]TWU38403.1 Alpha/beta hydrolase family protein [Novipirellula artificiosorum]
MTDSPSQTKPKRGSLLRKVRAASGTVAITYGILCAGLVAMETRLVYPGAYMDADTSRSLNSSPAIETVHYESAAAVSLSGRLLERRKGDRIVLFFHGNATKAIWEDRLIERLARNFNATVMAAEYRGFDGARITPTEKGVVMDCIAARDYLCRRYEKRPDEIILYGQSLGGGCAAAVAADGSAKALILERTFDSTVDVAAKMYWFIPVRLLMRNRFDSVERLRTYQGPLIQIHGRSDEILPIENASRLFDSVGSENKQWIEVEQMGHNDRLPDSVLRKTVDTLLRMERLKSTQI